METLGVVGEIAPYLDQLGTLGVLVWVVLTLRRDRDRDLERFEKLQERHLAALDKLSQGIQQIQFTLAGKGGLT